MGNFDTASRGLRPSPIYNFDRDILQLTSTSAQAVWTNNTEGKHRVKILCCNVDVSARTLNIFHVKSGSAAGATNRVFSLVAFNAGETVIPPWEFVLKGGDSVWAQCDAANVMNCSVAVEVET